MSLSDTTLQRLTEARDALDEFYERRLAEIDNDVRNLREYGAALTKLGTKASEGATDEALSIIDSILAS